MTSSAASQANAASAIGQREAAVGEAGEAELHARHLWRDLFAQQPRGRRRREVVATVPKRDLEAGRDRLGRLALRVVVRGALEDLVPAAFPVLGERDPVGVAKRRETGGLGDADAADVW
jgi:hypothetical protein